MEKKTTRVTFEIAENWKGLPSGEIAGQRKICGDKKESGQSGIVKLNTGWSLEAKGRCLYKENVV